MECNSTSCVNAQYLIVCSISHLDGSSEVCLHATNGGRATASDCGRESLSRGGTGVELCLQVLKVKCEIEDVSIGNLQA